MSGLHACVGRDLTILPIAMHISLFPGVLDRQHLQRTSSVGPISQVCCGWSSLLEPDSHKENRILQCVNFIGYLRASKI